MEGSHREALKVAVIYGAIGALWILFSDQLLFVLVHDQARLNLLSTVKGWFFIATTAALLYLLVRSSVRKLRKAEAQAWQAQKNEALGRMAAGLAHDFNNVLQIILIQAQDARDEAGPDSAMQGHLGEIAEAGGRGRALVRQLMAFARPQGEGAVRIKAIEALRKSENLLRRLVRPPVRFSLELRSDPGWIMVDPVQLEQVLMNLVVNAVDAMPTGGIVEVGLSEEDDWALIQVQDQGPGIPADVMPHIFEPFFTTKGGQGTGLGLATVQGIVGRCGGRIEVESRSGQGSSFKVYLPRSGS